MQGLAVYYLRWLKAFDIVVNILLRILLIRLIVKIIGRALLGPVLRQKLPMALNLIKQSTVAIAIGNVNIHVAFLLNTVLTLRVLYVVVLLRCIRFGVANQV